jgi:phosphate butyryltransferase
MGYNMIRTLKDVQTIADKSTPKRLAVLAPEDTEFLSAVKEGWEKGYIIPLLIGDIEKIKRVSERIGFDCENFELIRETDRQAIANKGLSMLFSGRVDMVIKGQLPTAFVYKSVIREETRIESGMTVCVLTMWEIPGLNHFIIFTDVGVNIKPDLKAKINTVKNAVFLLHVLGNPRPKILALSGSRGFGIDQPSAKDAALLRQAALNGNLGECEVLMETNLSGVFLGNAKRLKSVDSIDISKLPDVLLVPGLDAGNILCKLDFLLPVTRRSIVNTSSGPVLVPSRADSKDSIVGEMAMGVVISDRMKKGYHK